MASLLLTKQPISSSSIFKSYPHLDPASFKRNNQLGDTFTCIPGRAYIMDAEPGGRDSSIFSYVKNTRHTSMSALVQGHQVFGHNSYQALADLFDNLTEEDAKSINLGVLGGTLGGINSRAMQFQKALKELQNSMHELRVYYQNKSHIGHARQVYIKQLRAKVTSKVNTLKHRFSDELRTRILTLNTKRGTVYTNSHRAIHVSESGRSPSQILQVADVSELKRALRFASVAKNAGRGLIALDVVNRGNNIINAYARNDGSGYRTQFKESTTFAFSAIAGEVVTILGNGLVVGLTLSPLGWAVIIGVGIIATVGAAVYIDHNVKEYGDGAYNSLMGNF